MPSFGCLPFFGVTCNWHMVGFGFGTLISPPTRMLGMLGFFYEGLMSSHDEATYRRTTRNHPLGKADAISFGCIRRR